MVVNVRCSECNKKCSAKVASIKELDAKWYCPTCFDSNTSSKVVIFGSKNSNFITAEQQALNDLKKFCVN